MAHNKVTNGQQQQIRNSTLPVRVSHPPNDDCYYSNCKAPRAPTTTPTHVKVLDNSFVSALLLIVLHINIQSLLLLLSARTKYREFIKPFLVMHLHRCCSSSPTTQLAVHVYFYILRCIAHCFTREYNLFIIQMSNEHLHININRGIVLITQLSWLARLHIHLHLLHETRRNSQYFAV